MYCYAQPANLRTSTVFVLINYNRELKLNDEFEKDVNKDRNTWAPINWKLFKSPAQAPKEYTNRVIEEIREIIIRNKTRQ